MVFDKFCKISGIHSVIRHSEASSSDKDAVEAQKEELSAFTKIEGYTTQQVFSCDKMGLFRKKMTNGTCIRQGAAEQLGHKPLKDTLTLLLYANASAALMIKMLWVHLTQTPGSVKD